MNAIKCIPISSVRSQPQNLQVVTNLWIALHDPEKVVSDWAAAFFFSLSSLYRIELSFRQIFYPCISAELFLATL